MIKSTKQGLLRSTMLGAAVAFGGMAPAMIATTAFAQDYTSGGVQGTVYNGDGTAAAGTTVTLRSNDRGFERTAVTDSNGEYRFSRLSIGTYTLSANGNTVEDVRVRVNSIGSYNIVPAMDEIVATAQISSSPLVTDFSANQLGLVVDVEETFNTQPLARNLASVALLAPGTTSGDSAFGNLASISGSSVAENAYYINGMNTTDFRNFVGSSAVPFEFYEQVETKTGGYAAEFGRSTGGVVNAVTKSGSNEFHFGANAYWEPDFLYGSQPDTFGQRTRSNRSLTERDNLDGNIWASGPIIKDRLFFFGLYNFQDFEAQTFNQGLSNPNTGLSVGNTGQTTLTKNNDPFFGAKLDFFLNDDHQFEYTFIRDENETITRSGDVTYDSDGSVDEIDWEDGVGVAGSGGDVHIGKYTGNFGENLTFSALYGHQTFDQTAQSSADDNPVIVNFGGAASVTGLPFIAGDWVNFLVSKGNDERELMRADLDYYLDDFFGDHHFRIGVDREKLTALDETTVSGGVYFAYFNPAQCDSVAGSADAVPANHTAGSDCVRRRDYSVGGSFETIQTAFYLQDAWEVTDRLTLNLGIRNETFNNKDADGRTFTKLKNQWAPRLGASYDLPDDRSTVFGSWGRYFLPVAANTNIRLAGAETFIQSFFDISGINADLTPIITNPNSFRRRVTGSGQVGETSALVNADLDPMYVDETIVGMRHRFESTNDFIDGWETSLAFTYRDLASTLEDVAIDAAVLDYCDREGIQGCDSVWTGFHQYVLTNPGQDMRVTSVTADLAGLTDSNGDPITELINFELSAEDLNYPKATRTYVAAELTAKKNFDWGLADISYTLSESRGNYEGSVKSDNGQDDAGITQDFDQPGLVDGAKGLLPNHRAHKLKVRGFYNVNDEITVGGNYRLTSPRKYGCIGIHPTDVFAQAYDAASNFCQGQLVPRGTAFESDWIHQFDMSFSYSPSFIDFGDLTFRADVFNILNSQGKNDFQEFGEDSSGLALASYGRESSYQARRRVRLGVNFKY